MKVEKYEIRVVEGAMDNMHGGGHVLTEFYIPDVDLTVNKEAVFLGSREEKDKRNFKVIEVDLGIEIVMRLADAILIKDQFLEVVRQELGLIE